MDDSEWWKRILRFQRTEDGGVAVKTPWYKRTYLDLKMLRSAQEAGWVNLEGRELTFRCTNGEATYMLEEFVKLPAEFHALWPRALPAVFVLKKARRVKHGRDGGSLGEPVRGTDSGSAQDMAERDDASRREGQMGDATT